MELTRIIHPIGQGGFYSETIKDGSDEINVVYDCGGNSKTSMEKYLQNYYPAKSRKIDAVFISHLHEDHINGLDYLLKNHYARYLILPQLSKDEILEVLLYNLVKSHSAISSINLDILALLNEEISYYPHSETRIIRVRHHNGERGIREEIDDNDLFDLSSINVAEINSGDIIYKGKWLFIPYNPLVENKYSRSFFEYFEESFSLSEFDWKDLPYIVREEGLDRCKKVYEEFFGKNHNAYSMTLFSGMANHHVGCCKDCYHLKKFCHHFPMCWNGGFRKYSFFCSPNCLYTGDFDTDNLDGLIRFYGSLWKTISSMQVPHHGSRNSYDPRLYEYAHNGFISVGERSRYHHPNVDTLIGIEENGCHPTIVTESMATMKIYHYKI